MLTKVCQLDIGYYPSGVINYPEAQSGLSPQGRIAKRNLAQVECLHRWSCHIECEQVGGAWKCSKNLQLPFGADVRTPTEPDPNAAGCTIAWRDSGGSPLFAAIVRANGGSVDVFSNK
jgi:hypothetical protein